MPNKQLSERDVFRAALGPSQECPPIEDLGRYASGEAPASADLSRHLKSCSYCQAEMHLLQTFQAGQTGAATKDVREVIAQLQARSGEIIRQPGWGKKPAPWWKVALSVPRLAQASLALAAILAVTGVVIEFRAKIYPPPLRNIETNQTGQEVFRSGTFAVISPTGDLLERPREIRWERVPKAVSYRVRLLEVDRSEIWMAETTEDHIELPPSIRARIVTAKTLFCEISAFDSSGSKVGNTGLVRFRLFKNAGSR